MQTKISWPNARKDYISDTKQSYKSIAEKYGVALNTVAKVAKRDDWREARENIVHRTTEIVVENLASELAEVNTRHMNTYKNMQALGLSQLNIALSEIQRLAREAKESGIPLSINKDGIIGQQRLKFLGDYMKVAMDGERITLGLATSVSINKNEVSVKDRGDLFEQVDTDDLNRTISKAIAALGQGKPDSHSAKGTRPSKT